MSSKQDLTVQLHDRIKLRGRAFIYKWNAEYIKTFDDYLKVRPLLEEDHKLAVKILKARGVLLQVSRATHPWTLFGRILPIPRMFWPAENLITTVGKQKVCDYLVNSAPSGFTHMGIGTGTNAPAVGDTALQTQTDRLAVNDKRRVGTDAKFDTFYPSTSPAVGGVIAEMGVFDAGAGGNMYARSLVSPTQAFTTGTTLTTAYTSGF